MIRIISGVAFRFLTIASATVIFMHGCSGSDACRPDILWDRKTGAIDPAVAERWKRYDIRRVLEDVWPPGRRSWHRQHRRLGRYPFSASGFIVGKLLSRVCKSVVTQVTVPQSTIFAPRTEPNSFHKGRLEKH
jgi:hypothetical protein